MKKISFMALILVLLLALVPVAASAAPSAPTEIPGLPSEGYNVDDVPHPLGEKQRALQAIGLEAQINGQAKGPVVQVAQGQYVELERQGEDSIWTLLAEFGDGESPFGILQGGMEGPQRNEIPEPDRTVDNTTIWVEDFSEAYFEDLLFSEAPGANSMRNFYIEQSSNRYAVNGDVTDWVQVPYRTAHYGRDWCGSIVCSTTWWFVQDAVNQFAAGMTTEELNDYLSQFDVWDRYDQDGDGNFNEPDGYIDHFQIVHAGEGQEAGGGSYGSDAIWSHRWYVQLTPIGGGGPTLDDGTVVPYGGTQIGDSKYWIGDYTIEPENGGVGVFAHEFAHDLGLPDLYDTAGNTGGGENSTGFWTIMSSGSWLSQNQNDIGSEPGHFGAWEKFQLGWLNYEVAFAGQKSEHKLGPAETNTKQAQGLFVVLPGKYVESYIADPYAGDHFFYSGSGNNLDNVMYKSFNLTGASTLTAMVNYEIEVDWDYAYVVVSEDGGTTWHSVPTDHSTNTDPHGQNFGYGITGDSGGWASLTADLTGYSGDVLVGFRYWTDVAAVEPGFMVDDISVDGSGPDGGEGDEGWTFDGFRVTTGSELLGPYSNYYVVEFRQYRGYDAGLANAYNFIGGNLVERFPYQDGMLVSYWDTSFSDNNMGANCDAGRCGGLILPVDAHPDALYCEDGDVFRNRVQTYDSTFTLEPTDALELFCRGDWTAIPSLPAVSIFDDTNSYYDPANPSGSVIVPNTGTQIRIKSISALGTFMQVQVRPSK